MPIKKVLLCDWNFTFLFTFLNQWLWIYRKNSMAYSKKIIPLITLVFLWVINVASSQAAKEFLPYFSYTLDAASVANGGLEEGERATGLVSAGFDWAPSFMGGGMFHVEIQNLHGSNPSDYAGDFNWLSNIAGHSTTRLFQMWYGHDTSWGAIKAGLVALDDDFAVSAPGQLFINSGFGPTPVQSGNVGAPYWPIGGLGIWSKLNIGDNSYLQAGIYEGDTGSQQDNEEGVDLSLSGDEGAMIMLEYVQNAAATTWKLGGYLHTGREFTDYATGRPDTGLISLYTLLEQDLTQNVGIWGRFGTSLTEEVSKVRNSLDVGLVINSIFGRAGDRLGLAYLWTDFADEYGSANPGFSSSEKVLELTYSAVFAGFLTVQPDIQWIFDSHYSNDDVFVFLLRAGIGF